MFAYTETCCNGNENRCPTILYDFSTKSFKKVFINFLAIPFNQFLEIIRLTMTRNFAIDTAVKTREQKNFLFFGQDKNKDWVL